MGRSSASRCVDPRAGDCARASTAAAEPLSCYVIFSSIANPLDINALDKSQCNCANGVGSACTGTQRELRTVVIPRDISIELRFPLLQRELIIANPISGGTSFEPSGTLSTDGYEYCVEVRRTPRGRLRTGIGRSGRTTVCSPDGSVPGVATCPAYSALTQNCRAAS